MAFEDNSKTLGTFLNERDRIFFPVGEWMEIATLPSIFSPKSMVKFFPMLTGLGNNRKEEFGSSGTDVGTQQSPSKYFTVFPSSQPFLPLE